MDKKDYAKYAEMPKFSYMCITYLMQNNELIWKLLKYNDPDAWNKPDLTFEQKANLIYRGQEDATLSNVFMDIGQPDVFTKETTIIRICPYSIHPDNNMYGTLSMSFEVYSHNKINQLSNFQTRVDTISQQFLEVFNGAIIGGIGKLYFNILADLNDRLYQSGQIPFKGKTILMSNKST